MKQKNEEKASRRKKIIILILLFLVIFSGFFAGMMFLENHHHSGNLPKNSKKKKPENKDLNLLLIENVLTKKFANIKKLRQAIVDKYNELTNKHLNINNVIIQNPKNIDSGSENGMDSLVKINITIKDDQKIVYDFGTKIIKFIKTLK